MCERSTDSRRSRPPDVGLALVDKDKDEAESTRRVAMWDRLETARETAREDRRRALIADNGWIFALIAAGV